MHELDVLRDIGIAISAAAVVALGFHLARLPLLLGYLAAGVLVGPHLGLGLIHDAGSIATLSELGLILLMFILGLEIDLHKLAQAGRAVIVNGVTQFAGCLALGLGFFALLGHRNGAGSHELTYLAFATALSSTLVVVKLLSARMELDTLTSRITLGVLVLQDLWAIAFLAVQPDLSHLEPLTLATSVGKAALLVAAALLAAWKLLPAVFRFAARQPELLLVAATAWCATMCGFAGWLRLSYEMGALVAGVSIATFPYHVDIVAKLSALRDFFVTLFFVALGLQIPVPGAEVAGLTAAIVAFVLLSRLLTVFPVLYVMRYGVRASLVPAVNLSQVSEFALVVVALGVELGHVRPALVSAFVIAMVVTALLSSAAIPRADAVVRWLRPLLGRLGLHDEILEPRPGESAASPPPRVVLLGFYREASSLLQELLLRHPYDLPARVLVVDYNPESIRRLKEAGVPCVFGDVSHVDTLRHLGLEDARLLVCTLPDHQLRGISNLELLGVLRGLAPTATLVVTAETIASGREMYAAGADYVFTPRLLAASHLAELVDHVHAGTVGPFREESRRKLERWAEVLP